MTRITLIFADSSLFVRANPRHSASGGLSAFYKSLPGVQENDFLVPIK